LISKYPWNAIKIKHSFSSQASTIAPRENNCEPQKVRFFSRLERRFTDRESAL
jgi:hypothetical protein